MSGSKQSTPKIPRVVTFDIMRGFFLIAIVINHIYFFPNMLDWLGMRGQLMVSTAEGFFFLSGLVLGLVRGAKLVSEPFKKVTKLVLKRTFQLLITYAVLVIVFTAIAWYLYPGVDGVKNGVMAEHSWWRLIIDTFTLQYTYGWADYLRFYVMFLAVTPLALWLLRKKLWYIVLALSVLIWYLSPVDHTTMSWTTIQIYQPIPWQLLFFSGIIIGFHWPDIAAWWQRHKQLLVRYFAWPIAIIGVATLCFNVFTVFAQEFIASDWARHLAEETKRLRTTTFYKEELPLVRYLLFLLWFWAAFFIIERFQKQIIRFTGWLLIPFGVNSLYVYTLHAVLVFFVHIYFSSTNIVGNFLVTAGVIAIIYAAIRTKFLMNIIPR